MKTWLTVALSVALISCSGSSSDSEEDVVSETEATSFDDFRAQVMATTDEGSTDCGTVAASETDVDANVCVSEAFSSDRQFYAFYQRQGFDSEISDALSRGTDGAVYIWHFDSNPTGGVPAGEPQVEQVECVNAELTGSVDGGYADVFACDE